MRRLPRATPLLLGLAGGLVVAPAYAQSMRCGQRLVSVGDTAYELTQRCGRPDHRTTVPRFRAVTVLDRRGNGVQRVVEEEIDVLTYAGRDGDLPRIVTVRRGIIAGIRTTDRIQAASPGCSRAVLGRRPTAGEVHLACGRPVDQRRWFEEEAVSVRGVIVRRRIPYERWVYDPGPGGLLRILHFRNGRLQRIETGNRSPARP